MASIPHSIANENPLLGGKIDVALQQLRILGYQRWLTLFFTGLAMILFFALVALIDRQVERGKSMRMEQNNQLQALSSCRSLLGDARHGCRERAMSVAADVRSGLADKARAKARDGANIVASSASR